MLKWKGKTEYVVCTLRSTWHSRLKKIIFVVVVVTVAVEVAAAMMMMMMMINKYNIAYH